MSWRIRSYGAGDEDPVVALSLRAWAPVFASMEQVLGTEICARLHGADWRIHQGDAVRAVLTDASMRAWVAADQERIVGFAAATVRDVDQSVGEVVMLAVPAGRRAPQASAKSSTGTRPPTQARRSPTASSRSGSRPACARPWSGTSSSPSFPAGSGKNTRSLRPRCPRSSPEFRHRARRGRGRSSQLGRAGCDQPPPTIRRRAAT